ncbi:MAG: outer membrane lipid asymmetry maintenance protein MlaD [Alphaproteobacteria bacterium]|nr:outer membrane lipid asymmetry maintenance protein MlaD [Alphaproteobacteria bacterium]
MRESLFETLVGVLVVAVAGAFLFFSLQQRSSAASLADSYALSAKFNRIDGVSTGTDVRVAGVKVGSVTSIKLDPKSYKAVVDFSVKKGVEIPDDTTAQVISDGLLGGSYIGLLIGGSSEFLPDDGTGMVEYTRGSVDLLTVLSEFASSAGKSNSDGGGQSQQGAPQ